MGLVRRLVSLFFESLVRPRAVAHAALFGFPSLKVELDVSEGGALGDQSAYVQSINGWTVEAILEEITAASDTADRWAAVGITKKSPVVIESMYDNTASKMVAITKANIGETRTLQLTFDGATAADVIAVETIIQKIERLPARNQFTRYRVTLQPTGAIS